jgi:hypothetical protein
MSDRMSAIRKRCDRATAGPWKHDLDKDTRDMPFVYTPTAPFLVDINIGTPDDAAFIAHAREDIPWLLSELDRLSKGKR